MMKSSLNHHTDYYQNDIVVQKSIKVFIQNGFLNCLTFPSTWRKKSKRFWWLKGLITKVLAFKEDIIVVHVDRVYARAVQVGNQLNRKYDLTFGWQLTAITICMSVLITFYLRLVFKSISPWQCWTSIVAAQEDIAFTVDELLGAKWISF